MIRLQKWLALGGVASRRKAEALITQGKVTVNGHIVTTLGTKADPKTDIVALGGKTVTIIEEKVYIMLHKPEGVVTTVTDPFGRPTVMDLLDNVPGGIYPVGRLDQDTSGLLLLTNDGNWAQQIAHPKNQTKKVYIAVVVGIPTPTNLRKFAQGLVIDGQKTAPATIKLEETTPIKGTKIQHARLRITIHEGRNRQVRNMCEAIGHKVVTLQRIQVGSLLLGKLPKGTWRKLSKKEISTFRAEVPR